MKFEREKKAENIRMTSSERFISDTENLILSSLCYRKFAERFENGSDVMRI